MNHNSPSALGWVVLVFAILAFAVWMTSFVREQLQNRRKYTRITKKIEEKKE